ncbi:MAG: FAD-binding protein [Rubrivivax sp.]|nr:FAD-binding protein [Rhodocyclaceae bacterium]MCZ8033086.1 FAD-binding protein [Rubrivivax sp.]
MLSSVDLSCVEAIARHGELAAAARELKRDPSTLFRWLKALETRLGASLFSRTRGRYVPSQKGAMVVEAARRWATEVRLLERDIAAGDADNGARRVVRITTTEDIAVWLLPSWLAAITHRHPAIRPEVVVRAFSHIAARPPAQRTELIATLFGLDNFLCAAHLQAAVRIRAAAGVAMVPRSGGASYTDGYLYAPGGHALFDLGALDSIEIDVPNAVVTCGPGATWAALRTKLAEHGLRTPFWGPFPGLVATIGGSVSQNALSHGSGAHGISGPSVLSMDIVLASGELMTTAPSTATRNFGPDMTGLFTGDCGVLGMKAAIRLPLIAKREHFEAVSFAFETFENFHAGVRASQLERLDDENFGLDIALSQGQIAKQDGVAAKAKAAGDIMRAAPSKLAGLKQLAGMAVPGERAMRAGEWMHHFIIKGADQAEAAAKAKRLRTVMAPYGREIANSVPGFVRTLPFAPLTNILGPKGERWVPLHGVLNHSNVIGFHDALTAFYEERAADMERLGVWAGGMFSPVGSTGFLYEIALYWPDARTPYHEKMLDPAFLAGQPSYPANPEARAYIDQLKRDLVALYAAHGAAHFQLGRAYPYRKRLDPRADALLGAIKAHVDPKKLMNPGGLRY